MRALSRLRNLLQGVFAQWVGYRERRNPAAVYEAAIQERAERYRDLEKRLASIRDAEAAASARAQLDELKRSRGRNLLPVVLVGSR